MILNRNSIKDSIFFIDSPRACMRSHVREGVKHDIHMKPKDLEDFKKWLLMEEIS